MAEIKQILIEIDLETGGIIGGSSKVNAELKKLGANAKVVQTEVNKAAHALQKNMAGSAGIAGAATAEFGRLISDLPYGIQAVTNNISQLGSMFALLVSSAGGARKALQAMLVTLSGPAGWLIAFQAAIAALEYFSRGVKSAKDAIDEINGAAGSAASELKALRDMLRLQTLSFEDSTVAIDAANEKYRELNLQLDETNFLTDESKISLDNLIKSYEEAARAKVALSLIEDAYQKKIEKEIHIQNLRNKEVNLFTNTAEYLKDVMAGFIIMPELGRSLRLKGAEYDLNKINESITDIINLVGEEGLADKIYGPQKEGDNERAKRAFFPFLSDEELNKLYDNIPGTINYLKNQIAELEKQRDTFATTTQQVLKYNESIAQLEKQLNDLQGIRPIQKEVETVKTLGTTYQRTAEFKKMMNAIGFDWDVPQEQLKDSAEKAVNEFQEYAKATATAREGGDDDWLLKTLGVTPEQFKDKADKIQAGLNAAFDLVDAQLQRDIALEEAKTIALNDQLRERLRNEELTAEARDKINQEIAKNEAALVEQKNKIEKKRFQINKAQGIANAIINTAVAITDVAPNIPLMAFIGALGAAQVATIASQAFVPTPSPTPNLTAQTPGGGAGGAEPQFNVIGATGQNQLAAAIAATQQQPVKAYVVSNDVTTAQSLDRNIVAEASL